MGNVDPDLTVSPDLEVISGVDKGMVVGSSVEEVVTVITTGVSQAVADFTPPHFICSNVVVNLVLEDMG